MHNYGSQDSLMKKHDLGTCQHRRPRFSALSLLLACIPRNFTRRERTNDRLPYDVPYSYLLSSSPTSLRISRTSAGWSPGDFTLGKPLTEFEQRFAALIGTKHAIGVDSGTDALKLSLKALGVGHGDEVITTANTFVATVGAIAEIGARPVFVDCDDTSA